MAQIDIQGLFKDILPSAAVEDKAEGLRQAELLGTLGGMAAYFGPQRERQLRRSAGGLFGVDLRSDAEKAREDLKAMGTPKTMQEHQRYADILDRVQAGAGLQYMMGIGQEARAQQQTDINQEQVDIAGRNVSLRAAELAESVAARQATEEAATQTQILELTRRNNVANAVMSQLGDTSPALKSAISAGAGSSDDLLEIAKGLGEIKDIETMTQTIVNEDGIPEIILFNKETGEEIQNLGVDKSVTEIEGYDASMLRPRGQEGSGEGEGAYIRGLGNENQAAAQAAALARSNVGIAFYPDLESVVGPSETRRAIPNAIRGTYDPAGVELIKRIERSITDGGLPLMRILAPVTDTDAELVFRKQYGFDDSQEAWITGTLTETLPLQFTIMSDALKEEGDSTIGVNYLKQATVTEIFKALRENPQVLGRLSIEEVTNMAYDLLPNVAEVRPRDVPRNSIVDREGNIYSLELLNEIMANNGMDADTITEQFGLVRYEDYGR